MLTDGFVSTVAETACCMLFFMVVQTHLHVHFTKKYFPKQLYHETIRLVSLQSSGITRLVHLTVLRAADGDFWLWLMKEDSNVWKCLCAEFDIILHPSLRLELSQLQSFQPVLAFCVVRIYDCKDCLSITRNDNSPFQNEHSSLCESALVVYTFISSFSYVNVLVAVFSLEVNGDQVLLNFINFIF